MAALHKRLTNIIQYSTKPTVQTGVFSSCIQFNWIYFNIKRQVIFLGNYYPFSRQKQYAS